MINCNSRLLQPTTLGAIPLKNAVVMAPMTRSRASDDDLVTELHVEYYSQRANAGMIITEGVHPSKNGKGYCRTPGIYTAEQVAAWRRVTDAVHKNEGTIVCQLMHCGRVGHPDNKAADAESLAPSAIRCREKIYTENGMQEMPEPRALDLDEIASVIDEYRAATLNALEAGFDGVELHCASGYLPAQFLSTGTNKRKDKYGGSLENRVRFVLEVLDAITDVAGGDRVGMRICPGNPFNDLSDENAEETFSLLMQEVNKFNLAYLHVIRMPATGINAIELAKKYFNGPLIVNDSYDAEEAEQILNEEKIRAVSFGRYYIANPDLVQRFASGSALNKLNPSTLYTPGAKGYIDYPCMT